MLKKTFLVASLLLSLAQAEKAWVLKLEYKNGQVSLLEKSQIEAKLKKSRLQQSETEFRVSHSSEFGFVLKDSDGKVIKAFEGNLPGKVHADFAEEDHRHFEESFAVVDTFQVIIPAVDGSSIEFVTREPKEGSAHGQGGAEEHKPQEVLPLRSAGSIEL